MSLLATIKANISTNPDYFAPVGSTLLDDGLPSTGQVETLYLNRFSEIDNPDPAPTVPKPFTLDNAVDCIPTSIETMSDQTFSEFEAAVNNGTLRSWQRIARVRNKITADEQAALIAMLDATVPDPSHPAKVPAPHIDGLSALISEALGRKLEPAGLTHPDVEQIIGRPLTDDEKAERAKLLPETIPTPVQEVVTQ